MIANNICVNANSGVGSKSAYTLVGPLIVGGVTLAAWTEVNFYNNTAIQRWSSKRRCLHPIAAAPATAQSRNSRMWKTIFSVTPAVAAYWRPGTSVHDYNDYFNRQPVFPKRTGCASIRYYFHSDAVCRRKFRVAKEHLLGPGHDLSSLFATDYFGNTRTMPWDMSATEIEGTSARPNPPTGLLATVN